MVDGSLESRVEFLLSVIEHLLSLTVEALQGKCDKNRCLREGVGQIERRFQGGRGRAWRIFFGFYKTRHILLSVSANCTVLRAVVLTQYRRVTDGQTDGIAVASTALAKRRAVKNATNSRTSFSLRRFTKALAVIHRSPLGMHTVIIPILVYFFIARPMSAT